MMSNLICIILETTYMFLRSGALIYIYADRKIIYLPCLLRKAQNNIDGFANCMCLPCPRVAKMRQCPPAVKFFLWRE